MVITLVTITCSKVMVTSVVMIYRNYVIPNLFLELSFNYFNNFKKLPSPINFENNCLNILLKKVKYWKIKDSMSHYFIETVPENNFQKKR